jgi:hypothetical protein
VRRIAVLLLASAALYGPAPTATAAPPPQVPGCPVGYEKGSTIDFPQFAFADENQNGLVCFRALGRSGRFKVTDDDGTIG